MEKNKQKQLIIEIMNEDAKDGLYNKQTAVEWLQECLNLHLTHEQKMQFEGLFQQAKEMEKQQIIDAANTLLYRGTWPSDMWAEQYYNEKYGKQ